MALVKYREFEVQEDHLGSKPLVASCPVIWVREHLRPGDKLGLFIDSDNQDQLIIRKVEPVAPVSNGESSPTN